MPRPFGPTLWQRAATLLLCLLPAVLGAQATTGEVRGKVTSTGGRGLPEVQVWIPGTTRVSRTDANGEYRLTGIPVGAQQLRAQQIGFTAITRAITVAAGEPLTVDFELREAPLSLDAVVVTGTAAEARKKEVGNSMAMITSRELESAPVKNTQDIISARAPGVTVLQNSGQPGTGGTIRLRGINSITQGNSPIIYVDGIRIYSAEGPILNGSRQSSLALNDIKAEDIDRLEVVKGAAATTLYGTEASGGVIQIFTKKGTATAPEWGLDVGGGFNNMGHVGPSSDPTGVFVNKCTGPDLRDSQDRVWVDPTCPKSGSWLRNGAVEKFALSVRGGAQAITYFLSGAYDSDEGVIPTSSYKSGGVRGNFSFSPVKSLIFNFNTSYNRSQRVVVPDGNYVWGFMLNVNRGSQGNFKGGKGECVGVTTTCLTNSYILDQQPSNSADHFIGGLTANWSPFSALTNRFAVGYDFNSADGQLVVPFGFINLPAGRIDKTDWYHTKLSLDYAGSFQKTLFGLASTSSWGGQYFRDVDHVTGVTGNDFTATGDPTLATAARVTLGRADRPRVVNAGLFLQEMIGWRDRLFVTGGLRVDGNSAFGSNFGLQQYPKLSVAYVVSEEGFWPKSIVPTMKLRAAVGESGKAPGAFDAVRTWDPIAADEGKPAITPSQIGNPDLGPERTREAEIGFDATVLQDRVSLEATAYRARTYDALIGVLYPPSLGFPNSQLENVGTIQNEGIELQLSGNILQRSKLEWTGRVSYTGMRSKTLNTGGREISQGSSVYVLEGQPVAVFRGYKVRNPDAYAAPDTAKDQIIGPAYPTKLVGVSTAVTLFRDFTLDVLGEFQGGHYLGNFVGFQNAARDVWYPCYAAQKAMRAAAAPGGSPSMLDGITALDRVRCSTSATVRQSDYWIQPADFFKLRSASLSWRLPQRFVPRTRAATLTFAGRNLWKSTKYNGLDPELRDASDAGTTLSRREYYQIPPARQFLASLRVTF